MSAHGDVLEGDVLVEIESHVTKRYGNLVAETDQKGQPDVY